MSDGQVIAPVLEKDLSASKTFWGVAALLLGFYGPKWNISAADQGTVIATAQNIYAQVQQLGQIFGGPVALLGTLVRTHKITSVFGFKLQGGAQ